MCPARHDHYHGVVGPWRWVRDSGGQEMNIRLCIACLPVWEHFKKHHPAEAKEMMDARQEHGMGPEEGIPGTGWTGGYIGTGGSTLHKDSMAVGLTAVVPLGVGWVEGSIFTVPEISQGMWLQAGDTVYLRAHDLHHGSTEPAVQEEGTGLVVSLYCQNKVRNAVANPSM